MTKKYLTKEQVISDFKQYILPAVIRKYGNNDIPAKREAWNNYTDLLCKNGQISQKQYDTWTGPF